MTITVLLGIAGLLLAAAFVLAPLVRDEEDLEAIRRPRPGTRHLHGPGDLDSDPDSDAQDRGPDADGDGTVTDHGVTGRSAVGQNTAERRCPHCGAAVEEEFSYCGECLGSLK